MNILDQAKKIYEFFNSFGVPAYLNGDVPVDAKMPYITYQLHLGSERTSVQVMIYTRSNSYIGVNTIAEKIINKIGEGYSLPLEKGAAYIYCGQPLLQNFIQEDDGVKSLYLALYMRIHN